MQAHLFELSAEKGYDSEAFVKAFMNSSVAEDPDKEFNHTQWAGEEYLPYHSMSIEMAIDRLKETYADKL